MSTTTTPAAVNIDTYAAAQQRYRRRELAFFTRSA